MSFQVRVNPRQNGLAAMFDYTIMVTILTSLTPASLEEVSASHLVVILQIPWKDQVYSGV
jgi:hypothetical protein